MSGNISYLGADFNSIVKKGQVIAKLDPSLFEAQLQQAKANLKQTRANLNKAQSDLERAKVHAARLATEVHAREGTGGEAARAPERPGRGQDRGRLGERQPGVAAGDGDADARPRSASRKRRVNQNQVNLDHTIIEAPIDGIIIQRSVDVGQTVAASMQAPTLFIIAADLTKMQVNANIDEADVGRIRPGQHVTFHVSTPIPADTFEGTVSQIRLQPVVVQNVTTYGTVIDVPNPELKLKPGMTANVKVEIAKRTDVAPRAERRAALPAD